MTSRRNGGTDLPIPPTLMIGRAIPSARGGEPLGSPLCSNAKLEAQEY